MSEQSKPEVIVGRRVITIERLLQRRDGRQERREMVVHPGSVVLVPVLDDGRVVLVRQWRFAIEKTMWELPAGTLEPGEEIATCAARELEEETGYRARSLEPMCSFYSAPGSSNERMFAFLARGLERTAQRLDPGEDIEVAPVSVAEALELIRTNQIDDAKTMAALLHFVHFRSDGDAPSRVTWVG